MRVVMTSILLLLILAALYFVAPWVAKSLLRARFLARVRRSGRVCLTFDDGPHPETTPHILALLSEAGVKATFYILGCQAEQFPYLIAMILRQGHEIGEHGYGHAHAWKSGPLRMTRDLIWGRQTLDILGVECPWRGFRPPYGKLNLISLLYIWLGRRSVAFWNVDPRDYDHGSAEEIARVVLDQLKPGSVVLLHDGRIQPDGDAEVTAAALRMILKSAAPRRLSFSTVSEALHGSRCAECAMRITEKGSQKSEDRSQ